MRTGRRKDPARMAELDLVARCDTLGRGNALAIDADAVVRSEILDPPFIPHANQSCVLARQRGIAYDNVTA